MHEGLFFSFRGRINRAKFWLAWLGLVLVQIVISLLTTAVADMWLAIIVAAIGDVGVFISTLAVYTKRLHDRNKSFAWTLLFLFGPIVLFMIGIVPWLDEPTSEAPLLPIILSAVLATGIAIWGIVELGCLRGTLGANRYGPDPLDRVFGEPPPAPAMAPPP